MKSDNKNQRERERERREKEEFVERISVLLKSRPRFVEPKKEVPLSEQTFYYFLEEWKKKMSHTK